MRLPSCDDCVNSIGNDKCLAFPDGIPSKYLWAENKHCNNGYGFVPNYDDNETSDFVKSLIGGYYGKDK